MEISLDAVLNQVDETPDLLVSYILQCVALYGYSYPHYNDEDDAVLTLQKVIEFLQTKQSKLDLLQMYSDLTVEEDNEPLVEVNDAYAPATLNASSMFRIKP